MNKSVSKWILYLYGICFFIGGMRHWFDIARDGIFPYKTVPFIFNFYLASLAVLDLIVILLLFIKPIHALVLAVLIMASDLLVDFYLGYNYWGISLSTSIGLQLLLIFGVFVFISAPLLIKQFKKNIS